MTSTPSSKSEPASTHVATAHLSISKVSDGNNKRKSSNLTAEESSADEVKTLEPIGPKRQRTFHECSEAVDVQDKKVRK